MNLHRPYELQEIVLNFKGCKKEKVKKRSGRK